MTPNEKAVSIYNSMRANTTKRNNAKRCAIIAVDEIIEELAFMWCGYGGFEDILDEREAYYIEVKQEIEKI